MSTELPRTQSLALTRYHGGVRGACLQLTLPYPLHHDCTGKGYVWLPLTELPALIADLRHAQLAPGTDSEPLKLPEPRVRWEALKAGLAQAIRDIDTDTPWQEVEPGWWLDMMRVDRLLNRGAV